MDQQKNISDYIKKFIAEIKDKKSLKTAYVYQNSLNKFIEICGNIKFKEIDANLINRYFVKKLGNKYKLSKLGMAMHLQHVRYFIQFLEEKGIKTMDPKKIDDRKKFKQIYSYTRRCHRPILTDPELEKILNYWQEKFHEENPRILRNQIIINILINTGILINELKKSVNKRCGYQETQNCYHVQKKDKNLI